MPWFAYVAGAVLSWGVYGAALHKGQVALGNPMRAFLCVGIAYFLIGILGPVVTLASQGELRNFNAFGTTTAINERTATDTSSIVTHPLNAQLRRRASSATNSSSAASSNTNARPAPPSTAMTAAILPTANAITPP